jgi:hypothetical protein
VFPSPKSQDQEVGVFVDASEKVMEEPAGVLVVEAEKSATGATVYVNLVLGLYDELYGLEVIEQPEVLSICLLLTVPEEEV